MNKPWLDKAYMYDRYVLKRMTITEIAKECTQNGIPVSQMTIFNHLKKLDLVKNSRVLGPRTVGGNTKKKGGFYG